MNTKKIILLISLLSSMLYSFENQNDLIQQGKEAQRNFIQSQQNFLKDKQKEKPTNKTENSNNNSFNNNEQNYAENALEIKNDVFTSNDKTFVQSELKAFEKGFDQGYILGQQIAQEEMIAKLHKLEKYLDSIFNFQRLYIENKIEPPKILIRKSPVEVVENGKLMIIEQEQIEIIEPARLLAEPKNWRNFIIE